MSELGRNVFAVAAIILFAFAGFQMIALKSQSVTPTVAELFDNYVGYFSLGMAALTVVVTTPSRREPPKP